MSGNTLSLKQTQQKQQEGVELHFKYTWFTFSCDVVYLSIVVSSEIIYRLFFSSFFMSFTL